MRIAQNVRPGFILLDTYRPIKAVQVQRCIISAPHLYEHPLPHIYHIMPEVNNTDVHFSDSLALPTFNEVCPAFPPVSTGKPVMRPSNSFMLYRSWKHKHTPKQEVVNQTQFSQRIKELWHSDSIEVRKHFSILAEQVADAHKKAYPDYKFIPQRKQQVTDEMQQKRYANYKGQISNGQLAGAEKLPATLITSALLGSAQWTDSINQYGYQHGETLHPNNVSNVSSVYSYLDGMARPIPNCLFSV